MAPDGKIVFVPTFGYFSKIFEFLGVSNWKPKAPGFPGNRIGNPGSCFRAILNYLVFFLGHYKARQGRIRPLRAS